MPAALSPTSKIEPTPDLQDDPQPNPQVESKREPACHPTIDDSTNRFPSTSTILSSGATTPEPKQLPPLPYSLYDHKLSIGIIWTLIAIDTAILPLALFYPLWYATEEQPWVVIAITSSVFGLVSGAEWIYRTWKLWKDVGVRPLGSKRRWEFDFFHISYTLGYGIALLELIIGAAPNYPLLRLCALPTPTFIIFFGALILLFSICEHRAWPAPFRISSQPKGAAMRPCTYMITEDVIAVDTGSGRSYRKAINERYEASPIFRKMLRDLDLFWGVPAVVVGLVCLALIYDGRVPDVVAYGIGWGIPPTWAMIWALITTKWVQITLKKETNAWIEANKEDNNV